jgi:hypothetical protein
MLPPLQLQVAAGANAPVLPGSAAAEEPGPVAAASGSTTVDALKRFAPWLLLLVGLVASFAWWRARSRLTVAAAEAAVVVPPSASALADALKQGDLAAIAQALCAAAGSRGDDLDALRSGLDDVAQADAVQRLQAARWGGGDAQGAVAALRRAFAKGPRWRRSARKAEALLPPLYPE